MKLNLNVGKFKRPIYITPKDNLLWLKFGFNRKLINEIKEAFDGARWHPEKKQWSIKDCEHNWFQFRYLSGANPYRNYDAELQYVDSKYPLREHQHEFVGHVLTRRCCIIAGEMGTGKTLAIISALERMMLMGAFWWVAPRSALNGVELEFDKWKAPVKPRFITYASLGRAVAEIEDKAPEVIIFDESSRLKNIQAQRTEAAAHVAEGCREDWGERAYVVLMTGSAAPKSPLDWYSQCEIACPGFLREGNIHKFKNRIAIVKQMQSDLTGGSYPQLVTWRDDENKCDVCGELKEHTNHDPTMLIEDAGHEYKKGRDELSKLHIRMQGLVLVKFKKDCTDLPDKQYQELQCKTPANVVRAAKLILARNTGVRALTLLRELSDGFQYKETPTGEEEICERCKGEKTVAEPMWNGEGDPDPNSPELWVNQVIACPHCSGVGKTKKYIRSTEEVECPKDGILQDLIDLHSDVGRLVIYGGFTGSVDRCVGIVKKAGWNYIRVDGRGWHSDIGGNSLGLLKTFQNGEGKIAFVGQPGAAGMGLTLTASPSIVYFSNDFNGESRIQSEDRIHRIGMDANRGATIYDILNLPTDKYVLDNLKAKRNLLSITLGDLKQCLA